MTGPEPEKFTTVIPVVDEIANDEQLLAGFEAMALDEWYAELDRHGTTPTGDPTVTREPNPTYGYTITDARGTPILDQAGQAGVDRNKLYIYVTGWATRPDPDGKP